MGYNYCHFRKMMYCVGDSEDGHPFEEWLECSVCGHMKPATPPHD